MPAFTNTEIDIYTWVLKHPGCTAAEVAGQVGVSLKRVHHLMGRLVGLGLLERWEPPREPGDPPRISFRYQAKRGLDPIEQHQRELAERQRRRQALKGRPKRRGARRHPSRDEDEDMSKAEWEALVVNYERLHPELGWTVIEEHLAIRSRRGQPPLLSMSDYDRLRKAARR